MIVSCADNKKQNKEKQPEIMTPVVESKDENSENVILSLLKGGKKLHTGKTGFSVIANKKKIFWFKQDKNITDADLDGRVIITIYYHNKEKKQLAFNVIDKANENIIFNETPYFSVDFDYEYDDDISNIQVGQYNQLNPDASWNLSIFKNLIVE